MNTGFVWLILCWDLMSAGWEKGSAMMDGLKDFPESEYYIDFDAESKDWMQILSPY